MRYIGLLDTGPDGAFGIVFPDCPGCTAMGKDENEAFANAIEALAEWLGDCAPDERPAPRGIEDLRRDPEVDEQIRGGAIFLLVPFIQEKGRPTRANISLDAGLLESIDEAAATLRLTRSGFLAQAAREKIERSA